MNRKIFGLWIIIAALMLNCSLFQSSIEEKDEKINNVNSNAAVYSGSDPKGDFIEIRIDHAASTITHVNHTTGITSGPYNFSKVPQGSGSWGFDILYKAQIDAPPVKYALFAIFENTCIVYQLFNDADSPIGNPNYALIREELGLADGYEHNYNWMKYRFNAGGLSDQCDMEAGFAAFDSAPESGNFFGASYSNQREMSLLPAPHPTNGITNINPNEEYKLDFFTYDPLTVSYYMSILPGMAGRFSLIPSKSDAIIMDFGPAIGGGSGLILPQANNENWSGNYNGTYLSMHYNYNTATAVSHVYALKYAFNGALTGELDAFNLNDNTAADSAFLSGEFEPVCSLAGADSPGGVIPIAVQFRNISENIDALSPVVHSAHLCRGAFVSIIPVAGGRTVIVYLMFEPMGRFGSYTGFTRDAAGGVVEYYFGFLIKDKDYSNTGL